jgi:hypothetical protein
MRKLNQIKFASEDDAKCMHCDRPFEKPYNRMPELETAPDVRVLKCAECGYLTVFRAESSLPRANIPPFDPPGTRQKDLFAPPSPQREPGEE